MILLFFITILLLIYIEFKRTKLLLSFYSLFLFYGFLYTIGIFFSDERLNEQHYYATFLIILAMLSFVVGYHFCKSLAQSNNNNRQNIYIHNSIISKSYFFLVSLSGIALFLFCYVVVAKIGFIEYFFTSRAGRSILVKPYSVYMIFVDLFNIISVISLFQYLQTKKKKFKKIFILISSIAILHAIFTISRNNLVLILLPLIYTYHYFGYIKPKIIASTFFIGLLVAIFWKKVLFALIFSNFNSIDLTIDMPNEFYAWHPIAQDLLKLDLNLYGSSYYDAIASLIYPFYDADNLSIWYVKNFEFDVFAKGGGRGFSNVLEAYLNFGILGVFFVFLILGFIAYLFQLKAKKSIYMFFPYVFSLSFIHRIFRSDFLSLTKTWWWMYFISFIIILIFFKPISKNEYYQPRK